ncbi:MAG: hypothetical protein ACYDEA_12995 [Candidatus Dormibacteria bacterium]
MARQDQAPISETARRQLQLDGLSTELVGAELAVTERRESFPYRLPSRPALGSYQGERVLVWAYLEGESWTTSLEKPTSGCLQAFCQLGTGADQAILRFAQKWGPLGLCQHGRPQSHLGPGLCQHALRANRSELGLPSNWEPGEQGAPTWHRVAYEPLDAWRRYARAARVLLEAAAYLRPSDHKIAPGEVWEAICPLPAPQRDQEDEGWPLDRPATYKGALQAIHDALGRWLSWGAVRPVPVINREKVEVTLRGWRLPGRLAVELATAVTASERESYVCDLCGALYVPPDRRPRAGYRHYCPACRGKDPRGWTEAKRRRQQEWRARRKAQADSAGAVSQ